ncbi:MAG: Rossmann-like and DUF2520 domain-containing protein [Chitinophagaceae bacterium]
MDIVIFGSGNVAWSLGHSLHSSGHKILQIISRNSDTGAMLSKELSSEFVLLSDCNFTFSKDTICIIAYPDDILRDISKIYQLNNCIAVHTAGSVSMNILSGISLRYGVFYPLQTLKTGIRVQNEYPILIDANDPETLLILNSLASSISNKVERADDTKREKVHLAAVIVNNLVNHLYTLTSEYCKRQNIDFHLLMPLLYETISRIEWSSPSLVQTGPAVRNDQKTINRHIKLMDEFPDLQNIYKMISESIQKYYHQLNK